MEFKEVEISYAVAEMINIANRSIEKNIWPDEEIHTKETFIYTTMEVNLKEEEKWFKDNVIKYINRSYIYLIMSYEEKILRKHMYAIYSNLCYKAYKNVPVSYHTFDLWLNKYVLNRKILSPGGEAFYTLREMLEGRKLLKYTYMEMEAIERFVSIDIPLGEQKELIENVYNCFDLRWKLEREILAIVLSSIGVSASELIPNQLYIKYKVDETKVFFDGVIYTFKHDGVMKGLIQKGLESEEQDEDNEDSYNNPLKEIEMAFENIEEFNKKVKEDGIEINESARELGKLYWIIRKHFLEKGMEYDPFICRLDDGKILLEYIKEFKLIYKENTLYRDTMEEIYNLDVLLYEIEKEKEKYDEERKKREVKAKFHFYQFLDEDNRKRFEEEGYILLESRTNKYIIHKLKSYNNLIKLSKQTGEQFAMCLTPKDPAISQFDVFTTIVMLLQSGEENRFLDIANLYPLADVDKKIIQSILEKEKAV